MSFFLDLPSYPPTHGSTTLWMSGAIGTIATLHILTSGLVSAGGQLGPISEMIGFVRRRTDYDRLARGIAKYVVLYFAISSALAFLFITVALTALAGSFWTTIVRITWWPLVVELFAFLFEVILAYLWYYSWDTLSGPFKPLHMAIGGLLVLDDFLQVLMINVVASYMLTPTPPTDVFRVIVNPTFYELQVHRIIANLAYLGFFLGAVAAWRYRRSRDPEDRAHWDWAGSFGMIVGTVLTLMQPVVGYSYAKEIQLSSYAAWYRMMLGQLSTVFLWQITLLGLMFVVAALYFARRLRSEKLRGRWLVLLFALGLIITTIFAALPYQLAFTYQDVQAAGLDRPFWQGGLINPLGAMIPWKILALTSYSTLMVAAVVWYLRGLRGVSWGRAGRGEQRLLVIAAVLTVMMIVTMGFIRENGRAPDLIYGQIDYQQQPAPSPSAPPPPP
ncbi:MAG: cytochrome ubiquinol oxidase subunit I [Candidatus Dormibacteraeota bacterium]|nr:cytochrome ubiquinol oxidase subunit I [Candidatus Dormibacteraeota bacterium]